MDGRIKCGCGVSYFPALAWKHRNCLPAVVVHAEELVVHKATDGSSRHGRYKDLEARRSYRREWMRKRRQRGGEEKGSQ